MTRRAVRGRRHASFPANPHDVADSGAGGASRLNQARRPFGFLITVGAGLVIFGLLSALTVGRTDARRSGDSDLLRFADRRGAEIEDYSDRSAVMLRLLAQHPSLSALAILAEGGRNSGGVPQEGDLIRKRAEQALAILQAVSPGRIGEVSLIDHGGRELVRVVRGQISPVADLSPDESSVPFFKPTRLVGSGYVYESAPYVSPETDDLVVSYSMRLPWVPGPGLATPRDPAILHFEVSFESFRRRLQDRHATSWIVDARAGRTLADSGVAVRAADFVRDERRNTLRGGPEPRFGRIATRVRSGRNGSALEGVEEIGGVRYAYRSTHPSAEGPNKWVVVVASAKALPWYAGFGFVDAGSIVAGLFLVGVAALARRNFVRASSQAQTDELTGLANRRVLRASLTRLIADDVRTRERRRSALLFIDVDRFKDVNDTFGHHHGDRLLCDVAIRLKDAVRDEDLVVRLGGDEFAILMSGLRTDRDVSQVTDAVERAFHEPFLVNDVPVVVSASTGVAHYPADGTDAEMLMRHADVAMYEAKHNHVSTATYSAGNDPYNADRLEMLGDLRAAIRDGALTMHYQPVIDPLTGIAASVEALARWLHPTRGNIPPTEFIAVAETAGLMRPLTEFALRAALTQLRIWVDAGLDIGMAVNVSAANLVEADLVDRVRAVLRETGVEPHRLTLELTETAVISDPERAHAVLGGLKNLGLKLAVDDYGTGNASIGYLRRLPFDVLKIDRSFVDGMATSNADAAIVRTTIDLGQQLGLRVVAEGVENASVIDELVRLGCDLAQGYHVSRPGPAAVIGPWLHAHTGVPDRRPSAAPAADDPITAPHGADAILNS